MDAMQRARQLLKRIVPILEVTVFSDTLEKFRDALTPGQNVVLTVEATMEADQLKPR